MFQRDMFSFSWLWILLEIADGSVLGVEQVALKRHFHTDEFCTLSLCHWHFKGLQILPMFQNYPPPLPQNHSSVFSEPEIWLSAQDGTFKLESADPRSTEVRCGQALATPLNLVLWGVKF